MRLHQGVLIAIAHKPVDTGLVIVADVTKVKLAIDSFAKDDKGRLIGVTSSESKAIVDKVAPAKAGG